MIGNDKDSIADLISKKVGYYYKANKPVHIKLNNGEFRRGYIRESGAEYLILDEFLLGEQTIFFIEIYDVNDFKAVSGASNG